MILEIYTLFHVLISLAGIIAGFLVLCGMLAGKRLDWCSAVFLTATLATSVTGFFFPVQHFMPSHAVGLISLAMLAVAIYARYPRQIKGGWSKVYVIAAMLGQYLNVFVLIVQLFMKVPALKELAPTQTEPPFKITQLVVLIFFVLFTVVAAIRFRPEPIHAA